ncbi:Outer membrane receptor proteins, mostly Fe transport [Spirosomataceae bacterium TFI 002]|nr:Outer membrane receptor proteins, mostly Fe transport [Spirosomataceae bacterium TFI 002]
MKKLLLLITGIAMSFASYSQAPKQISGLVLDNEAVPLPFANVLQLNATDSALVKATTTDIDGKFLFETSIDGQFLLKISMVGFEEFGSTPFFINDESPSYELKNIKLALAANQLGEVEVVAKKPFIEQQIDKTVLNVENSIVASGNTLLQVLEKAPGVVVDRQNSSLRLKNKNGVQVMIDGKLNYLSQEALMEFLNNTNSEQVATIEIITNPSSKYDAAGNAGIINIKLKKNKNFGTNGSLSLSAGDVFLPNSVSDLYRGSGNLSLNHRTEKVNLFTNLNAGRNAFYSDNTLMRSTNFEGLRSEFDQVSRRNGKGLYQNARVGADIFLSKKTTLGFITDVNNWDGQMVSGGLTKIKEVNGDDISSSSLTPISDRNMKRLNFSFNSNLKHEFNDKGKELTFDIDYSGFRNNVNQTFANTYYDDQDQITSIQNQRNRTPTDINIFASKIDFVIPTENKTKIEFGAKTSYVKTDNDFVFEQELESGWESDAGKTNHFIYTEWVNAAYINVGHQWDKIGLQTGLRAEHTKSEGHSITLDERVPRSYLSLFPTMFVTQKINDENSLRYSYSRRIGRPNYEQLNPFLFFLDPYTFEKGNEYLKPQFTENIEVAYTLKDAITLSLGYAFIKDNMFDVIEQDDATRLTFQTQTNLEKVHNYSANLSFPVKVTKWWMMQNNLSAYYNKYMDSDVSGGVLNVGQFAYNFYTSSSITLKNDWSAQANMWYNSPNVYGIIRVTKPQYAVNLGVQKSILDKKGKLKFNINDIFLTSFSRATINYQNVDLITTNRWASRSATISFTYNFGNQNVKGARNRNTASEDLKQRAGGNN